MLTVSIVLAMLVSMAFAVVAALYLPVWASVSITVGVVVTAAVGGPTLLAKVAGVGAMLALGAWCWRRHARRQKEKASSSNVTLATVPEPRAGAKLPRADEKQPNPLRRAA